MAGTFNFELVSPERVVMSEEADEVVLCAADGQMTVLAGHSPVIATLRPGLVDVRAGSRRRRVFVGSGFAEIESDRLTILAERAIDADELKGSVLDGEIRSAEAAVAEAKTDEARLIAQTALDNLRSLTR